MALTWRLTTRRLPAGRALPRPEVKHVVLGLTIAFVVYQVVVPLFFLVWGSLKSVGPTDARYFTFQLTLDNYLRALGGEEFWAALGNTLVFALGSTALASAIGVLLALIVARTDAPLKGVLNSLAYARIIVPGLLTAIAWVFLASPEIGLLNRA